jgi:hypothetical protein
MMKKAENIIVGISRFKRYWKRSGVENFEDSRMLELCTPVILPM